MTKYVYIGEEVVRTASNAEDILIESEISYSRLSYGDVFSIYEEHYYILMTVRREKDNKHFVLHKDELVNKEIFDSKLWKILNK